MSIVNTQFGHAFVHVPKTGGTSMERQPFVGGNNHDSIYTLLKHPECHKLFKWAFVRNPYDRLLSFHSAVWQHPNNGLRNIVPSHFPSFVFSLLTEEYKTAHLKLQSDFLCVDDKVVMDFVGRFETIQQDWKVVCKQIGVPSDTLRHLNATEHSPWEICYTDDMRCVVYQFYKKDFTLFNYKE